MNVNITISFDVKIVRNEINKYNTINSIIWLLLYFFINIVAIYLKKPDSSNDIDKIDIHINKTNIFKGFRAEFENNTLKTEFLSKSGKAKRIIAPNNIGMKKVSIVNFFNFKEGNFKIHINIPIIDITAIPKIIQKFILSP